MSTFKELFNLDGRILKAIEEAGYETPTSIQQQAIPKILEGLDLIASAQTGTGKTAAFMLPAVNRLVQKESQKANGPKMLVLVPTRELAMQVAAEAQKYCRFLPKMKTVCIFGGVPYPIQKRSLSKPYEILVATPGRLIDFLDQGRIDLSSVQILALDEADRMLDMGFIEPVERIASETPEDRQTLLFSATLDRKILSISKKLQKDPFEIKIKPDQATSDNIEQRLYYADNVQHKKQILEALLQGSEIEQAIIFTSTINQANILSEDLTDQGYPASALHGDLNQRQRTKTINKLRDGSVRILVATDVAARGIDIPALSHVINFDLPFQAEDFVHRIGRTGRAGAKGVAITFATYREDALLANIGKMTGKPLSPITIEGLEPKPKSQGNSGSRGQRSFGGRNSRGGGGGFGRGPRREGNGGGGFGRGPRREGNGGGFGRGPRREREEGSFGRAPRREESHVSESFDSAPAREGNDEGRSFSRPPRREGNDEVRSFNRPPRREGNDEGRSFNRAPRRESEGGSFGRAPRREGNGEGGRSFNRGPRREGNGEGGSFGRAPRREGNGEGGRSFNRGPRREGNGGGSFGRAPRREGNGGGGSFGRAPRREGGDRPQFSNEGTFKRKFRKESTI